MSAVRLVASAALAVVAACSGINAQTHSFNTLADAQQAGAVQQGLLPAGLPTGTRDIRTAHVPGTRERWGLFNFPPSEAATLKGILNSEEIPLTGRRVAVPGRIEWWPPELRGDLDAERLRLTGLRAYATADASLVVVVQWSQGRAYFWSAP